MVPLDVQLTAEDGRVLAASVDTPAAPVGALVILSALGVPRGYYRRFAAWMSEHGVAVLTFDYRGVGGSQAGSLRRDPATLLDWARLDASAALAFARERWRGLPLWGLGHSFGGQAFGLTPGARQLDGAVVVAAASGDLAIYPPALRRRYALLLGAWVPVITAVAGYVPGRLGVGEDLPSGVMRQWASWCLTPGYVRGALGREGTHHHLLDAPMRFYDFPDDTFAPLAAAAELRSWYEAAEITHRTVIPQELGLDRIGHFGFFRPGPIERLWAEIRDAVVGPVRPPRADLGGAPALVPLAAARPDAVLHELGL